MTGPILIVHLSWKLDHAKPVIGHSRRMITIKLHGLTSHAMLAPFSQVHTLSCVRRVIKNELPPFIIQRFFMWFSCQSFWTDEIYKYIFWISPNANWCYFSSLSLGFQVWLTLFIARLCRALFETFSNWTKPCEKQTSNVFLIHCSRSSFYETRVRLDIYFKHCRNVEIYMRIDGMRLDVNQHCSRHPSVLRRRQGDETLWVFHVILDGKGGHFAGFDYAD